MVDRELVLTQCIVDLRGARAVVDAFDLHDDTEGLPGDIEVDQALRPVAHDLTAGCGESSASAQSREIEFAESLRAVDHVSDDG